MKQRLFIGVAVCSICFFCLLPLMDGSLHAAVVIIDQEDIRQNMGLHMELLVDKEGTLSIDDIVLPKTSELFFPSRWEIPNLGEVNVHIWVKIRVKNNFYEKREYMLEVPFAPIDLIELYLFDSFGNVAAEKSGESVAFDERKFRYPNPLLSFSIDGQEEKILYLRYYDEGSIPIPLTLWSPRLFVEESLHMQYLVGLYYGIIVVMIPYNLFLFVFVRDRSYLFYTLYVATFGIFQMAFDGLAQKYIWPGISIWWSNRLLFFFMSLAVFFFVGFSRYFLHTGEYAPRFEKLIPLLMIAILMEGLSLFVFPFSIVTPLLTVTAICASVTFFLMSVISLRKGYLPARFYLIAFFCFVTGVFLLGLRYIGILPSNFYTENGLQIGFAVEVLLLSLALADRINILRSEKEEARRESIASLHSAHELKIKYSRGLERKVRDRTIELEKNRNELQHAFMKLEDSNQSTMDSIRYAKQIQQALLPKTEFMKKYMPNNFVIWMPRNIVGGDIFFFEPVEQGFILAVVDCTGHGVPGAFMTMIAMSTLRRIIKDERYYDPAKILERMNFIVKTTLQQDSEDACSDDGMDIGIVKVSDNEGRGKLSLIFAGANISLLYNQNGAIHQLKADRQSIGYRQSKRSNIDFNFTNQPLDIENGMSFYISTDGFEDQLGGDILTGSMEKRFGKKRLRELLGKISDLSFQEQKAFIMAEFNEHRGKREALDDVTVVGFGY
ncbi:7TM diverse intracellular signaling domain-containing protein [Desulfobacterales bacterium HSG16]|nr:7TM diverse intracellular signaling domain-containing protein [Desulfobacterales bacterium HSG16]